MNGSTLNPVRRRNQEYSFSININNHLFSLMIVMDIIVTYIRAVSLVKLLFAGSPACMCKTVYFIQWAHLHERANMCFKNKANRYDRVSFYVRGFGFPACG